MESKVGIKGFALASITILLSAANVVAIESRPLWFNKFDLPEHSNPELLDKDYSLNAVFTRYYENLEIPAPQAKSIITWKVDPQNGSLLPWYFDGDVIDKQILCTAYDAAVLAGPVKISAKDRAWFDENALKANFHFDLTPRLKDSVDGSKTIESIRKLLPAEKSNAAVIRAIPKQVLEYYPGLFTAEELDSPSNFRVVYPAWIKLHTITSLRQPWIQQFAQTASKPSRTDILYIRDQQDSLGRKALAPLLAAR